MASCQQYEEKLPCPQGQIVRVSCEAYPDRDMGVVGCKKVRLLSKNPLDVTQNWLKVDQKDEKDEKVEKGRNKFILLQPSFKEDHDELALVDSHKVVKGLGTDEKDPEVTLVDIHKVVTWTESEGEEDWSYISRAIPIDGKVWTAEESCDGIKIMLRPKQRGNPKQLWNIQDLIPK